MPEIPLKISGAFIGKKSKRATPQQWVREKVSFASLRSAPMLKGIPRRRNLYVRDRDLEIEKGQAGRPYTQQL